MTGYDRDRPRDDRSDRRPMGLNDKAEIIESLSSQRDGTKKDSKFDQTPPLTSQTSLNLGASSAAIADVAASVISPLL